MPFRSKSVCAYPCTVRIFVLTVGVVVSGGGGALTLIYMCGTASTLSRFLTK